MKTIDEYTQRAIPYIFLTTFMYYGWHILKWLTRQM